MFQPLAELEASVPGSTVIEFLATLPCARGRGIGRALLQQAHIERGPKGVSLVVSDNNHSARGLYSSAAFAETGRRAIITEGWQTTDTDWSLTTRS